MGLKYVSLLPAMNIGLLVNPPNSVLYNNIFTRKAKGVCYYLKFM